MELCPYRGFKIKRVHALKAEIFQRSDFERLIPDLDFVSSERPLYRVTASGQGQAASRWLMMIHKQKGSGKSKDIRMKTSRAQTQPYAELNLNCAKVNSTGFKGSGI